MRPAGIEPTFSSGRDGTLQTTGSKIPFDLRAALPRPLAWAGAILIELLLVVMLVFLARSQSYSLPEPIPVGVILERAPPAAPPAPPPPPTPEDSRGRRSGPTSGDSDKPVPVAKPTAGVADGTSANTPPTPAAPPTPLPSTQAASAPIEPLVKGRLPVAAAPTKSPTTSAAATPARPRPSPTRAPQGHPLDLASNNAPGAGDRYLNQLDSMIKEHSYYPEQARALGLTGHGIFLISVGRSGQIIDVKIYKSTGAKILDDAIIDSIRQASPFPAVPPDVAGDPLELIFNGMLPA